MSNEITNCRRCSDEIEPNEELCVPCDAKIYPEPVTRDACEHCFDNAATYTDHRLEMEFCSIKCANAEITEREADYESNRRYEIATGGQG